jgi:hypothetical protein
LRKVRAAKLSPVRGTFFNTLLEWETPLGTFGLVFTCWGRVILLIPGRVCVDPLATCDLGTAGFTATEVPLSPNTGRFDIGRLPPGHTFRHTASATTGRLFRPMRAISRSMRCSIDAAQEARYSTYMWYRRAAHPSHSTLHRLTNSPTNTSAAALRRTSIVSSFSKQETTHSLLHENQLKNLILEIFRPSRN